MSKPATTTSSYRPIDVVSDSMAERAGAVRAVQHAALAELRGHGEEAGGEPGALLRVCVRGRGDMV